MKQLSEHTAAVVSEAQEILRSGNPIKMPHEPKFDKKKFSEENVEPDKELDNQCVPSKIMVFVSFISETRFLLYVCIYLDALPEYTYCTCFLFMQHCHVFLYKILLWH